MMDLEESIECTKLCIFSSLEQKRRSLGSGSDISLDFITKECLARPPFPFIHALITIYVQHLSFAKGLYDDADFIVKNVKSRQDKIRFVFRMLVCIAKLTRERVDIFVSPVKLLSGQEVFATHMFLRCLAKAARLPCDLSAAVAAEILESRENVLYKRSVKTRNTITKLQAIVRGNQARNKMKKDAGDHCTGADHYNNEKRKYDETCNASIYQGVIAALAYESDAGIGRRRLTSRGLSEPISPDTSDDERIDQCNSILKDKDDSSRTLKRGKSIIVVSEASGSETISEPITSNDEVEVSNSERIYVAKIHEEQKQSRQLHVSNMKKVKLHALDVKQTLPKSAVNGETWSASVEKLRSTRSKKLKKCKIVNGVVTRQELVVSVPIEEQRQKDEAKMKSINELEADLKRKVKRLKEREARLDNRLEETKQKEEHLQMHEERVKRLAEKLRTQQNKLKKEGLRHALEMDKLRHESSYRLPEHRIDQGRESKETPRFSDELLRQACDNPTITDLRLALERNERSLQKRQERMARAEKELQQRILEFEHLKAGPTKSPPAQNRVISPKRTKKKKMKKFIIQSDEDSAIQSPVPILDLVSETRRRRQAFVPAIIPEGLKAKHKRGSTSPSEEKESQRPPVAPIQIPNKNHQLSTIIEEGELKKRSPIRKGSLPRSLINYTNNRNENNRQNYVALGDIKIEI